MRIAITGPSGFIGHALVQRLASSGHRVVRLVRRPTDQADVAEWSPDTGAIDADAIGVVDAVVHLAGENIAAGRWKESRKKAMVDSRGPATQRLCRTLAALPQPPRVLIAASATGIYGDREDEVDEATAPGTGFLAKMAKDWEAATAPARDAGMRVVNLRIGMVLDPEGGALRRMLPPFRFGLGGRLGSGRQWISWITRHDLLRVIEFVLVNEALEGPVLAVAPRPVTNREFTAALGHALSRPTIFPVPAFVLRLLFGEMADALLLAGQRAVPAKLLHAGFHFEHAELGDALRAML